MRPLFLSDMHDRTINLAEVKGQVAKSLINVLGKKVSNISLEQRLIEDLGVDSFASLELIFELEDALNVKIPDSEVKKMITVGDVVTYIHNARDKEQNVN
jgi:acyl carrier protein